MKAIRLIRTMVIEYTPDPNYYPEGATIEEMAEIDARTDDLDLLFEDCISDEVKYEIIDEKN